MSKCKALNEIAAFGYDIGEECWDTAVCCIAGIPVCFTHREKYFRIKSEFFASVKDGEYYSTDVTAAE